VVDVFIYLSSCILGCDRQTTPILLQGDLFFNLKLKLFGSTGTAGGLLADTNKKSLKLNILGSVFHAERGIRTLVLLPAN